MSEIVYEQPTEQLHGTGIQEYVPLGERTWFRTGGLARWLSQPQTVQEFQEAVLWAANNSLQIELVGEGANMLISDDGCSHLVIRPSLKHISMAHRDATTVHITAGAGVSFPDLITTCLAHNLIGLEEFSGIPGTVGGSVFINIHYFKFLLSDFLVSATVINRHTGELTTVDHSWFNFGYNQSTLQSGNYFLVDATFCVKRVSETEASFARGRSVEIIRHRCQRYPAQRTCGSFFRNFHEQEVTVISNNKKMIYVAYYLDKLGIKGELRVGGAQVSYQHANMIVTSETATSSDVIQLARTMQQMVFDKFHILPQPECRFVGFAHYPLLTLFTENR